MGKFYITNDDLLVELNKSKEKGHITEELKELLNTMVDHLIVHIQYRNDEQKQYCSEFAKKRVIKLYDVDLTKVSKIYFYYTEIIKRSIMTEYKKCERYIEIIKPLEDLQRKISKINDEKIQIISILA